MAVPSSLDSRSNRRRHQRNAPYLRIIERERHPRRLRRSIRLDAAYYDGIRYAEKKQDFCVKRQAAYLLPKASQCRFEKRQCRQCGDANRTGKFQLVYAWQEIDDGITSTLSSTERLICRMSHINPVLNRVSLSGPYSMKRYRMPRELRRRIQRRYRMRAAAGATCLD